MKQNDLIKQLSDRELNINLLLSQGIFLGIALLLSLFLFDRFSDWTTLFNWDIQEVIYFGVLPAIFIVGVDLLLVRLLPESAFDDGGINERIFANKSISFIFGISLLVAISEEILFRGVIQSTLGYIPASIIFAVVHFRYLRKPVLFMSTLGVSLLIGYLFLITGNLFVPITLHFIVDFLLGLFIRFKK